MLLPILFMVSKYFLVYTYLSGAQTFRNVTLRAQMLHY